MPHQLHTGDQYSPVDPQLRGIMPLDSCFAANFDKRASGADCISASDKRRLEQVEQKHKALMTTHIMVPGIILIILVPDYPQVLVSGDVVILGTLCISLIGLQKFHLKCVVFLPYIVK